MGTEEQQHAVMVPWSAFGHMMPFFQLSMELAKSGVKISFISTPRNIQRLPKVPPNLTGLINLVAFPLPAASFHSDPVLPEGGPEATVDISSDKIQYLKIAYDLLQHPFKRFVAEQSPDWIIVDVIPHWAAQIAREYQTPLVLFSAYSASAAAFFWNPECLVGEGRKRMRASPESMTSVPEWVDFPSSLAFRSFEAVGTHSGFYGMNASGISDAQRTAEILHSCQALAIRSCREYEGEYLSVLEKLIGRPVIPVGLLPPGDAATEGRRINDGRWSEVFQWLDEQNPRSVVFVGFGSECKLSKDQVYEIAYGLELSGLPFLWALREPEWVAAGDAETSCLPSGFEERTRGRGIVSLGWAQQMEILAHPSVGGSLFHAGWGSVIETLQFGHCLVVLPLVIDQPLNARVLVDKGLAAEVERQEDGSFTRDGVAKALRLVMVSDEGERLRERAREAAATFKDRALHQNYIHGFVEYLKVNAVKKTI